MFAFIVVAVITTAFPDDTVSAPPAGAAIRQKLPTDGAASDTPLDVSGTLTAAPPCGDAPWGVGVPSVGVPIVGDILATPLRMPLAPWPCGNGFDANLLVPMALSGIWQSWVSAPPGYPLLSPGFVRTPVFVQTPAIPAPPSSSAVSNGSMVGRPVHLPHDVRSPVALPQRRIESTHAVSRYDAQAPTVGRPRFASPTTAYPITVRPMTARTGGRR